MPGHKNDSISSKCSFIFMDSANSFRIFLMFCLKLHKSKSYTPAERCNRVKLMFLLIRGFSRLIKNI